MRGNFTNDCMQCLVNCGDVTDFDWLNLGRAQVRSLCAVLNLSVQLILGMCWLQLHVQLVMVAWLAQGLLDTLWVEAGGYVVDW
jgi:hypothetical protein